MTKLFISYAHLDKDFVFPEADALKQAGYDVWIDTSGIAAGDSWPEEITVAIKDCEFFLLFVSLHSAESDFVRREISVAFRYKRKILPLLLEPIEIPQSWTYQLVDIQYIDCREPDWKVRLLAALADEESGVKSVSAEVKDLVDIQGQEGITGTSTSLPSLPSITRELVFSNREKELQRAIQFLDQHRLLLITGMPGIGKTVFARALVDFKPDKDAFWYDFSNRETTGNTLGVLLEDISRYLDFYLRRKVSRDVLAFRDATGTASLSDVERLIGYLNQEKQVWLVFDNLETVLSNETNKFLDEGLELLFDRLKDITHNAKIIVTNPFVPVLQKGEHLSEAGTLGMELQGLDEAAGVAFLRKYGADDEESKLAELVRHLSGHPYFLNDIAPDVVYVGVDEVLANLPESLAEIRTQYARSLEERLSAKEFSALQCLTLLNRELRMTDLCHITQSKPSVIIHLREKSLLQSDALGKLWVHNIVRTTIKPTDPALIRQTHVRAMEFYRKQSRPVLYQSIDDYSNALEWHHHAIEVGDVTSAYSAMYSTGLVGQFLDWNEYELLVKMCEEMLASAYQIAADLASPIQANLSEAEQVKVHHTIGNSCFLLGDYSKSITHFDTALQLLRSEKDGELHIRLMIDLAEAYNGKGDLRSAMTLLDQLTVLLSTIQEGALQAKFFHLRGIIHRDSGRLEEAVDDLEKALDLYERSDRPLHLGNARIDLGMVHQYRNQFADAMIEYQRALMAFESQRDMRGIFIARFNLADIMLQKEQYQGALDEIRPALEIVRKRRMAEFELRASLLFVEAQLSIGNLEPGEEELKRVHSLVEKKGENCFSGQELVLLAYLYSKKDQPEQAMNCFVQAFKMLKDPDCQYEYAHGSLRYALFLTMQGDLKQAHDVLLKAKNIFNQINNQLGLQSVEKMLGTTDV